MEIDLKYPNNRSVHELGWVYFLFPAILENKYVHDLDLVMI